MLAFFISKAVQQFHHVPGVTDAGQVFAQWLQRFDGFGLGHDPQVVPLRQHQRHLGKGLQMTGFARLHFTHTLGDGA